MFNNNYCHFGFFILTFLIRYHMAYLCHDSKFKRIYNKLFKGGGAYMYMLNFVHNAVGHI